MPKVYHGTRTPNGCTVMVSNDGLIYALDHLARHSPSGLEWGYCGSGPADTALSILADCIGIVRANPLYMQFKEDVIASLPDRWELSERGVLAWVAMHEAPVAVHAISVPQMA